MNGTAETFEEVQDIIPRNAYIIMALVLAATDIFILACHFIGPINTPLWMFAATSAIFGGTIVFCLTVKLSIRIEGGAIHIRFLKQYVIPLEEVIDYKTGDIGIIRNYSGWGMKKVVFKNLICVGYENGVSLKLTGRRVFTLSVLDPERFASLLPPRQV